MKALAVTLGIVVLVLVWAGPLLDIYKSSFTAHMLAHMGVVAIATPLIALGIAGTRYDLSARYPAVFAAVPISFLELVTVWSWHAPALRAVAEASIAARVVEQASFLLVGLLLWLSCLGFAPDQGHAGIQRRAAAGTFGLLFTSMHMTLLGALLALTPRPLYGLSTVTCLGLTLDAGDDQQLGGVLMLMVGAAVYLAGGLYLMGRLLGDWQYAAGAASRRGGPG